MRLRVKQVQAGIALIALSVVVGALSGLAVWAVAESSDDAEAFRAPGRYVTLVASDKPGSVSNDSCVNSVEILAVDPSDSSRFQVSCRLSFEREKLLFTDKGQGLIQLVSVELELFTKEPLPRPTEGSVEDCNQFIDQLVPESETPSVGDSTINCLIRLDREFPQKARKTWVRLPPYTVITPETPCWSFAIKSIAINIDSPDRVVQCTLYTE